MEALKKAKTTRLSFSKKMIIIYTFFVLIPACTLIYLYYLKSSSIIETEVTNSLLQTLKQSNINISNKLNNMADISNEIFLDTRVQDFVSDYNNNNIPVQLIEVKNVKDMIISLTNKRENYKIKLYINEKKIASGEKINFFSVKDIMGKSWYDKIVQHNGGIFWTGVYKENHIDIGEVNIISCARILKHSFNYNDNDGVLLIDIPESNISSILSGINIGEGVYVIDKAGEIVSHKDKSKLGTQSLNSKELEYVNSSSSGIEKINKDGRDIFLVYQTVNATGWKMVAEMDSKDIIKTNTVFNNISTFVAIIVTFIVVVFGIFLLFTHVMEDMNKQVKTLVDEIEKGGVSIIDENINNSSSGDLTRLGKNVYNMMQKVKNLMEESYQAKIREREAQLHALQAQINPHFLYNTLDSINWMAIKIDSKEISFMVNSLAKYFRLSLSKGKDIVSIKDELELINVYLTIQQVRYKGAIQFEFRVEESVENYNIHKLTLQPIIENAIIHGIQKNKNRSGLIVIEAKKIDQDIIFTISDNGVGMNEEYIDKVLSNIPNGKEGSYGLYNVNERIKLYFGDEYGINIYSEELVGTKVEIKIKAM